jgi:hypothetical protein
VGEQGLLPRARRRGRVRLALQRQQQLEQLSGGRLGQAVARGQLAERFA